MWRAILGDEADETTLAENRLQTVRHVGHGRRDQGRGQLLGRIIGCEPEAGRDHDLRRTEVIARCISCHSSVLSNKKGAKTQDFNA